MTKLLVRFGESKNIMGAYVELFEIIRNFVLASSNATERVNALLILPRHLHIILLLVLQETNGKMTL